MFGPSLILEELDWLISRKWKGTFSADREGSGICFSLLLQNKYRKAAHMKIASTAGVLGEKIMIDSTYNSLVNDQGLPDTNIEGDLKVEHQNLELKTGLINLAGKYFRDRHSFKCAAVEARKM